MWRLSKIQFSAFYTEVKSSTHFLLGCPNLTQIGIHLMNEIKNIKPSLNLLNDDGRSQSLLYGDRISDHKTNTRVISLTIDYFHKSERFNPIQAVVLRGGYSGWGVNLPPPTPSPIHFTNKHTK